MGHLAAAGQTVTSWDLPLSSKTRARQATIRSRRKLKRTAAGLALAPLAPVSAVSVVSAALVMIFGQSDLGEAAVVLGVMPLLVALVAYPSLWLVGFPAHLVLQRHGCDRGLTYAAWGGVAGVVGAAVVAMVFDAPMARQTVAAFLPPSWIALASFGLPGMLGGWAFWWISVRPFRRPATEATAA